jgi:hypothetical protein
MPVRRPKDEQGGYGGDRHIQDKKRRKYTMKYLVIGNPNLTPIPPELAVNIYKAAIAWMDERLKNGKLDFHYIFAERGGFVIANVNSPEELFDEMLSYPLYPFFDWEVKALVEWKHGYNSIIDLYKRMGAK